MQVFGAFIALVNSVILFRQLLRVQEKDYPKVTRVVAAISLSFGIALMIWIAGSLLVA